MTFANHSFHYTMELKLPKVRKRLILLYLVLLVGGQSQCLWDKQIPQLGFFPLHMEIAWKYLMVVSLATKLFTRNRLLL